MDLCVRRLRVPEEVAGRVHGDHHRAVDALRVAPGVDHRRTGAGALADQVDAVIAEGLAGRLEVVDALGQRVAGEIDAVRLKPGRARAERVGVRTHRPRSEVVSRVLQRRLDLGAVELDGPVDTAVAHEDDVVLIGKPARLGELHVGDAGTTFEPEDGLARVSGTSADARDRQCDQPCVRVGAVLGHDQRSAVGVVRALVGLVGAWMKDQVTGVCTCGHGDGGGVGSEPEVRKTHREYRDEREGDDPRGSDDSGGGLGGLHGLSFRGRVDTPTLWTGRRHVVARRPRSISYTTMIRCPTSVGRASLCAWSTVIA